jgi:hypothetical protein
MFHVPYAGHLSKQPVSTTGIALHTPQARMRAVRHVGFSRRKREWAEGMGRGNGHNGVEAWGNTVSQGPSSRVGGWRKPHLVMYSVSNCSLVMVLTCLQHPDRIQSVAIFISTPPRSTALGRM